MVWFSAEVMAKFSVFERSTLLDAQPSELYAFHENPRNITRISPIVPMVERVECSVPAMVGDEFRLTARLLGFRFEWVGFWVEVVPDFKLVDGARRSPFRYWRHHHTFGPVDKEKGVTLMTDRVEYALSGGVVGRFLDVTVMKVIFALMFLVRHKATRAFFARMETMNR